MHKQRLLKLAQHLETGKLGHEEFNFMVYNSFRNESDRGQTCGYAGCAIGECPIVFPDEWEFSWSGRPMLKTYSSVGLEAAEDFFEICPKTCRFLFVARMYDNMLEENATRYQVATNIRAFVAKDMGKESVSKVSS